MTQSAFELAVEKSDCRLRVIYHRDGDRYSHQVELICGDRTVVICQSIEGNDHDAWPLSPPIQQLHLEDQANGRVILGVGLAGKSHWSVSNEAKSDTAALRFDWACRYGSDQASLGTTYRLLQPIVPSPKANGSNFSVAIDGKQLQCSVDVNASLEWLQGPDGSVQLRLMPTSYPARLPATAQWAYAWKLL